MRTEEEIKYILKEIIRELHNYYNEYSDYSKGYLDGLYEFCNSLGIPCERTELNLHILESETNND